MEYKRIRNLVTKTKRELQQRYYEKVFSNITNIKHFWTVVNNVLKPNCSRKTTSITELQDKQDLISDPLRISSYLNDYFVNIANKLAVNIPDMASDILIQRNISDSIFFTPTHDEEILLIINKLKNSGNKTDGYLNNNIVKLCKRFLIPYIVKFVNLSLSSGKVPSKCKIARVVPMYKNLTSAR